MTRPPKAPTSGMVTDEMAESVLTVGSLRSTDLERRLLADRKRMLGLLTRAALGQKPGPRAYHEPLCGECLGCDVRSVLEEAYREA